MHSSDHEREGIPHGIGRGKIALRTGGRRDRRRKPVGLFLHNRAPMRFRSAVLLATVLAEAATARADSHASAQAHFAAAERAYRGGRYGAAVAELRAGFALDPQPEYRVALAQAYVKDGEPAAALEQCRLYLASADDPNLTAQVRRLMLKLRSKVAAELVDDVQASPPPAETAAPVLRSPPGRSERALPAPSDSSSRADDEAASEDEPAGAGDDPVLPKVAPPAKPAAPSLRAVPPPLEIVASPASSSPSFWSAHGRTTLITVGAVAAVVAVVGTIVGVTAKSGPAHAPTTLGTLHF